MMTATPTKTSLENITLFHLCYFTIVSTRSSQFYRNYSGTKLVGVTVKLRKRTKNLPSGIDVLHKTLNLVILRCYFPEDDKEM